MPDRYPRVFACPDGRIAVDLSFDRWLMVDAAGFMGVANGELSDQAVAMLPTERAASTPEWRPVRCPQHGDRAVDLHGPVQLCDECRVVGADGKPLGWQDGKSLPPSTDTR